METIDRDAALTSLRPQELLGKLDLTGPGLEAAAQAAARGDAGAALAALREHYRAAYPLPAAAPEAEPETRAEADGIVDHVFQWGPYEAADYGDDVDWEWDPRGDIEWVAAVYRFHWALPLAEVYAATREEKYARAFVELTLDWIAKHPLEQRRRTHPVYTGWEGFAWLDIQTGIRATNLCAVFRTFIHAAAFSPEFLGVLLASLHDHQVKTERIPMGRVHNKAIFEQRGFVNVAHTFPEFRDSQRWLELGLTRARESLLAQTTADGVQTEWAFGYHLGVLRDAVEMMTKVASRGIAVPDDYRERVARMFDYVFAMATPDLGAPMFGDARREPPLSSDRTTWLLHPVLTQASEVLGDPKYAARARLDTAMLPAPGGVAFPEAGMYVLRDAWGPDQIYLALHCSPPGCSEWHDQPDNGTFELYAFGRWLMPDTGYYTYGHDPEGRAWHRRTRVHQALTLNGADSEIAARQLLWRPGGNCDALTVETRLGRGVAHRRTVWFVDRRFFVFLDEAVGSADGALELHFQLAPGEVVFDHGNNAARTCFPDANVLIWAGPGAPVRLAEEEGWFAWTYGRRRPRKALRYTHRQPAPAAFATLVVPFRGTEPPAVNVAAPAAARVGGDRVELEAVACGRAWALGRDLASGQAWCEPVPARG